MPLPLKNGEVLRGRYRLRERIGQGGMGAIYLADDLRLEGRLCALKEVEHDRNLPDKILKETREQFLREATVLARLDHPNLPKVSDFFTLGRRDFLVMDFIPGKDLRILVQEARQHKTHFSEDQVLGWSGQLCAALSYLHGQESPIVHRDIKPSNLKLTPQGVLKLVDFGLVKVLVPDEVTITIIHGQGTALYTPLEQFGTDTTHTDVRSDIFAFGATLYHLLTNEPPVDARRRFLEPDSLRPIRQLNPAVSQHTERAVLAAMALHPDQRPESVEIFRQMLIGTREVSLFPAAQGPADNIRQLPDLLQNNPERTLAYLAAGLTIISLIVSALR